MRFPVKKIADCSHLLKKSLTENSIVYAVFNEKKRNMKSPLDRGNLKVMRLRKKYNYGKPWN